MGSNGTENVMGCRFDKLSDRSNRLSGQAGRLGDQTSIFNVTNQPDAEPVEASTPGESPAEDYGVKERCERFTMKNQGLEREY
ncbi:MAG TPA: hypothetical protein DIT75_07190, partial [Rikenellaceae bacterium]|nr:hypothetical protein [Rikenellaceae bacterium]